MRYFLDISYCGTQYHGWQNQTNASSVQETIEEGLSKILREKVSVTGSGRTDTGVHAKQQIAHFDSDLIQDQAKFQFQLNSLLPNDIAIKDLRKVQDSAHARFDAVKRSYQYFINCKKDPFKRGLSYYFRKDLDKDQIEKGCQLIKETTDFQSFSKVQTEVNNFLCEIHEISWQETNDGHVLYVCANRFLRGMVRTIVGTLLDVGTGKLSIEDLSYILEKRDRKEASRSVPAEGLFLYQVKYPKNIYLR